ncbi:MAG TPA: SDR family oxidoreductase [Chitinophagales bacterium]
MEINLSGKNAFVSGGSKGIGKATAIALANLGANVTVAARTETDLIDTVVNLNMTSSPFQQHDYVVADYSDPDKLRSALNRHFKKTNKAYHILVNNAGGPPQGLAIDAKEEEFIAAFNTHLICNHVLVQTLVDGMKQNKYGRIINIISTSVKQPLANLGVSNTIRAAVANWAKTLANELGQFNITVNNVLPGATETERLKTIIETRSKKQNISAEKVVEEMTSEIPMKRFAKPEEVANAVAFLASPAASYINGINVPVDGGRTSSL